MASEKQPETVRYFDPNKFMSKVSGRDYLPVAGRLVWFREECPDWSIETRALEIDHEKGFALFRCEIKDDLGRILASGHKYEDKRGFPDYIEKSETGSVGRALLMLGYGTANAIELDEGERLADAPFPNGTSPTQGAAPARPLPAKAGGAVKPGPDAYALRDRFSSLAKECGFQNKQELDNYLKQKGVEKVDRLERMEQACDILQSYVAKLAAGEEAEVWQEDFEEENEKEAVAIV